MPVPELKEAIEWLEKKWKQLFRGPLEHNFWTRSLACGCGALILHLGALLLGATGKKDWSILVAKAEIYPTLGVGAFFFGIVFWALILGTVRYGTFIQCFWRGVAGPVFVYYFVGVSL